MKKEQFRKLVDAQFYQGNVTSLKQKPANKSMYAQNEENQEINELKFTIKCREQEIVKLNNEKAKLVQFQLRKTESRKARNSSLDAIQQINDSLEKQKIQINISNDQQKQLLRFQEFIDKLLQQIQILVFFYDILNQNLNIYQSLVEEYYEILGNKQELPSEQKFIYVYQKQQNIEDFKKIEQIICLSLTELNLLNLEQIKYKLNDDNIKQLDIYHCQGKCSKLCVKTNVDDIIIQNDSQLEENQQIYKLKLNEQKKIKQIYFSTSDKNKLAISQIYSESKLIQSIPQFIQIQDDIKSEFQNCEFSLHDIVVVINQKQIIGIQGIYLVNKMMIKGKTVMNSNEDSENVQFCNNNQYDEQRILTSVLMFQNSQNLALEKLILKYKIQNKLNRTLTYLQFETGTLNGEDHIQREFKIYNNQVLQFRIASFDNEKYLSQIELIKQL